MSWISSYTIGTHEINLLQRQSLGLIDEEICKGGRDCTGRAEDIENLSFEIRVIFTHQIRRHESDDEVPEPVRCGAESDAAAADGQGEHLARDGPAGGAPGAGESNDVETDEDEEHDLSGFVRGEYGADDGDDKLAHGHEGAAVDKEGASTETLDSPEGHWGRNNVHWALLVHAWGRCVGMKITDQCL